MTAPRDSANGASAANLFVEGEREPCRERTTPAQGGTPERSHRGRGLLIPVDAPPAAARFTRSNNEIGRLSASAQAQLRAADVRAGALVRRLIARRHGSLLAATALAAMLIVLGWLGLALHDASAARNSEERARTTATAALRGDQGRIARLTAQVSRTETTARRHQQASATAIASWRARAMAAKHTLEANHHRRRH